MSEKKWLLVVNPYPQYRGIVENAFPEFGVLFATTTDEGLKLFSEHGEDIALVAVWSLTNVASGMEPHAVPLIKEMKEQEGPPIIGRNLNVWGKASCGGLRWGV
jgi:hypothetical protein